jgi:hypothetical protein
VEIVQPFTVMVLADTDPGPPVVDDELDTEPPPACTCTPVPPAELLLETVPALLPPADAPAALMLPSACFSTETVQPSPDEVLPFLTMVSALEAAPPSIAVIASAAAIVHARVMCNSSRLERRKGGRRLPSPCWNQSLSFFISWPLPCSIPVGLAEEPAAPTVEPLFPPPADEPPVPTVDADPEPEPAAEPPVPTLELLLPPPAEVPPVPRVDAEPLPEPAAEPPVPTLELLVPPPAEVPPVPSVDAEPLPDPPADEPPVPTLELLVPPPAEVPPVPTVELDCATASAVPASNAAAAAESLNILIGGLLYFQAPKTTHGINGREKKRSWKPIGFFCVAKSNSAVCRLQDEQCLKVELIHCCTSEMSASENVFIDQDAKAEQVILTNQFLRRGKTGNFWTLPELCNSAISPSGSLTWSMKFRYARR